MDEGDARPGLPVQVNRVQPGKTGFELVLALAARVLAQDRSCACNQPRGMPHVAWSGRPMTPGNTLICMMAMSAR